MNVASRLTSHAKSGEVIISDVTKKGLKRSFEYEALPPFSMKGIDGTTGAWFVKEMLDDTNP